MTVLQSTLRYVHIMNNFVKEWKDQLLLFFGGTTTTTLMITRSGLRLKLN